MPHQYSVRGKGGTEEDYRTLWDVIHTTGVRGSYNGRPGRYLYPGDGRKYWHMGYYPIINRMRIEDDLDRIIAEGRLTAEVELLVELGYLTSEQGDEIRARRR